MLILSFTVGNTGGGTTIVFNNGEGEAIAPIIIDSEYQLPTLERTGYIFGGWYLNEEYSGDPITVILPESAENITLYSKWIPQTFTLTYVTNGGEAIDPVEIGYNEAINLQTTDKTGYSLAGWFSDSELTSEFELTAMPLNDLTVYAKWQINEYTIAFDSTGGSPVASIQADYASTVTAPAAPTWIGYDFVGWYTNQTLTQAYVFNTMPADIITVYAKWEPIPFSITYHLNGGENNANAAYYDITDTITLTPVIKSGYGFAGWYDNEALTGSPITVIPEGSVGNKNLYACFDIASFNIFFNSMEGSAVQTIRQEYNSAVSEPDDPLKANYSFGGWYTDQAYSALYEFNTMPAIDTTLYAKWIPDSYTLTFDYQGATADCDTVSKLIYYNNEMGLLPVPTKNYHRFDGWFTAPVTGGDQRTSESVVATTTNITLYARWTETYSEGLLFELNDDSVSYRVSIGTCSDTAISIPSSYQGCPVTAIADFGFRFGSFTEILIPASVVSIGTSAFNNCSELASIDLPSGITDINIQAFYYCSALSSINLSELSLLTEIDEYAFSGCAFTSIEIPEAVTVIKMQAFYGCESLTEVILPSSIIEIANRAFMECGNLENINLENTSVTSLEYQCFDQCSSLQSITFPATLEEFGANVFRACNSLEYIEFKSIISDNFMTFGIAPNSLNLKTYIGPAAPAGSVNTLSNYIGCLPETLETVIILENTPSIDEDFFNVTINFQSYNNIKELYIPNSISNPGAQKLTKCYNLETLTVPMTDSINTGLGGYGAYSNYLTTVNIAEGSTNIPRMAFAGNSTIVTLNIPETVHTIGDAAFYQLSANLSALNLPASLTTIGENIIQDANFTVINIHPDNTSFKIIDGVLYDFDVEILYACPKLLEGPLVIPATVKEIKPNAFVKCVMTDVSLEDGSTLETIGSGAFWQAELTAFILPDSLLTIGGSAFKESKLTGFVAIPESVTSVGANAFGAVEGLTEVLFGGGSILTSIGDSCFYDCTALSSVTLPEDLTSVPDYCFYRNTSLESITLPLTVTTIGDGAFQLSGITHINTDDLSITAIGVEAFHYCNGLTELTLKEGLLTIGLTAFERCSALTEIIIPSTVESGSITAGMLYGCKSLINIQLPYLPSNSFGCLFGTYPEAGYYLANGYYVPTSLKSFTYTGTAHVPYRYFNGGASFEEIHILNDTEPSTQMLIACSGLKEITVPVNSTVKTLKDHFDGANVPTSVTTVNITPGTTRIYENAFYDLNYITAVNLPDSVIEIQSYAFEHCDALANINLGNGVTTINNSAFESCEALTSIIFPDSLLTIKYEAFVHCDGLTSIEIPDSVTLIEGSAFLHCDALTDVFLGDGVTTVGSFAFANCGELTFIQIGRGVTNIENNAFYCNNLTEIIILAEVPPTIGVNILIPTATVNVLPASLAAYQADDDWNNYTIEELSI